MLGCCLILGGFVLFPGCDSPTAPEKSGSVEQTKHPNSSNELTTTDKTPVKTGISLKSLVETKKAKPESKDNSLPAMDNYLLNLSKASQIIEKNMETPEEGVRQLENLAKQGGDFQAELEKIMTDPEQSKIYFARTGEFQAKAQKNISRLVMSKESFSKKNPEYSEKLNELVLKLRD